jgi:hypothetical protein
MDVLVVQQEGSLSLEINLKGSVINAEQLATRFDELLHTPGKYSVLWPAASPELLST